MIPPSARLRIISRIKTAVLEHHFSIENLDLNSWCREVDLQTPALAELPDDGMFEDGIHDCLSKLKSSHTDFYRNGRNPIKPEHTIGATLRSVTCFDGQLWMFLDVFEDGPAARAGISPGHLLVSVNGISANPPDVPVFRFGGEYELTVITSKIREVRNVVVIVPQPKSTRPRLPFVEPKSLSHRMLTERVGLLKITFFSGMLGIRFSRILDRAFESLKAQGCDRLIVDLRGCLGGSLGFARLVSYLCPNRVPIGYDITRKRQKVGYDPAGLPKVRMPTSKVGVLLRLAQFSIRDKSLVLLTQGLGEQAFHGHVVVLINEYTSSAGEMAAQFAKDTKLATLVGQKTAGLVLGSAIFDVGNGYMLYLPVFGWYRPDGSPIEGSGVIPDVVVDADPKSLIEGNDLQLNTALEIVR